MYLPYNLTNCHFYTTTLKSIKNIQLSIFNCQCSLNLSVFPSQKKSNMEFAINRNSTKFETALPLLSVCCRLKKNSIDTNNMLSVAIIIFTVNIGCSSYVSIPVPHNINQANFNSLNALLGFNPQ